jgi:predicted aspartyl protease
MSAFNVAVVARNPRDESRATPPIEALVDSGSELTWLPADLLAAAGIEPRKRSTFRTATGDVITRDVGFAYLSAEGYETADEVVFAERGDLTLLGVRTIEGFAVVVDYVGHRFVARATLVAADIL